MKKLIACAVLVAIQSNVQAGENHDAHTGDPSNAGEAYMQSMQRMHDDMHKGLAAEDPDVAFAAGMLAHHEGAIDMARIQLQYGKDAEMRALARAVIQAQEKEVTQLKTWLEHRQALPSGR
jgi:uncharacterized protein (DUF305 family)